MLSFKQRKKRNVEERMLVTGILKKEEKGKMLFSFQK